MDNKTAFQRSKNMAAVKNKNTAPELFVRKLLFSSGFRYRLHDKKLPGSPDIVLKKYKAVLFVNGCFWHGHCGCSKSRLPTTNTDFWKQKIEINKKRDRATIEDLSMSGFRILVVWQCACKRIASETLSSKIKEFITGDSLYVEIGWSDVSVKG